MMKSPKPEQRHNVSIPGFNALDFSPDQPDEMGLWPKGVVPPLRVLEEDDQ